MLPAGIQQIRVNTGNLITCKEFNRRATQSPTEEVRESVCCTLHSWLQEHKEVSVDDQNTFNCINLKSVSKVDNGDRVNLKLTVKVFMQSASPENLDEAIREIMDQLEVDFIDSVILALPVSLALSYNLEEVKPLWTMMERFHEEGKVVTIGISDFDAIQLLELYNWAQIKPSVNQVNLESCCIMPREMTSFAKEKDIQLLTHDDPKDILPQNVFHSTLATFFKEADNWQTKWITRYSVVVKCRGIIQNKGYLLAATNDALKLINGSS